MPPQYWLFGLAPLNHLYTLARISCWPPEDGSICDPKHVGVNFTWTFNVFLINIELWVHELVIIETIDKLCSKIRFYTRISFAWRWIKTEALFTQSRVDHYLRSSVLPSRDRSLLYFSMLTPGVRSSHIALKIPGWPATIEEKVLWSDKWNYYIFVYKRRY